MLSTTSNACSKKVSCATKPTGNTPVGKSTPFNLRLPAMSAVMVAVVYRSRRRRSREGDPRERRCGKGRDVFRLVHGRVPFGCVC